jgi:hypothetical protein
MEIKYSSHAVKRMIQRKISPQDVELVISDHDGKIKQSKDKFIYYKKIKSRKANLLAAVTFKKSKNRYEVITLMINFEVKK